MEKKINLNYDKFEEKYPFDENVYIQALCKYLLENLSATVAKKKEENKSAKIKPIVINTSTPTKSGVDITDKVEKLYRNLLIRA